jgi:hypothetical protein
MSIHIATTDIEIAACFPVMQELRAHIAEEQFLVDGECDSMHIFWNHEAKHFDWWRL